MSIYEVRIQNIFKHKHKGEKNKTFLKCQIPCLFFLNFRFFNSYQ